MLKLTTDKHEASRCLSATAELLVLVWPVATYGCELWALKANDLKGKRFRNDRLPENAEDQLERSQDQLVNFRRTEHTRTTAERRTGEEAAIFRICDDC